MSSFAAMDRECEIRCKGNYGKWIYLPVSGNMPGYTQTAVLFEDYENLSTFI